MSQYRAPRGTHDILPDEAGRWHAVEATVRRLCDDYGYEEIRTPALEHTELFERGVGDTTDVVQKEMYTFQDKGGRSVTLRPEGTSPVARSFVEHSLYAQPQPVKLYYMTSCFRYEKPQAGRLREFHQFGVEAFGSDSAALDAEVISLATTLFRRLGIDGVRLQINSIGCKSCRADYDAKLRDYFHPRLDTLCETCRGRFEKNPLRILDCKNADCKDVCRDAPTMTDSLCPDCRAHFEQVQSYLRGMDIPFEIDPTIVRGLDYYTRTVFEFVTDGIGAQSTVCGGGRYNGLVEELGGPPVSAVGFGVGIERLLLLAESAGVALGEPARVTLFAASIGEAADSFVQNLVYRLRQAGVSAERDYLSRSVKAQMKYADKRGARYTVVIGDDEIARGRVELKNMETGEKQDVSLDGLADVLKNTQR